MTGDQKKKMVKKKRTVKKEEPVCTECNHAPVIEGGEVCHTCHSDAARKDFRGKKPKGSMKDVFFKGITTTNPVFVLLLGLCPTLAVSTSLDNAFGMSAAVLAVLLGSNLIVAAIRKTVPDIVRIPVFIVIIATFVTIVYLTIQATSRDLTKSLGIYIPLIVVNCIILGRAEAFASKNGPMASFADAIGIGIGFAGAIVLISFFRQILGTGMLEIGDTKVFEIPGLVDNPMNIFILPMGAFMVIGVALAAFRYLGVMSCE